MGKSKTTDLLFVYNADSGTANMLIDYGKKLIAPDTYDCKLCMISYGAFGMKRDWKKFIGSLSYRVTFLHRDEFEKLYPHIENSFPTVMQKNGTKMTPLITAQEFESITDLDTLIDTIKRSLSK